MKTKNLRPVLLLYDKSNEQYRDEEVHVGEFFINSEDGHAYLKLKNGDIVDIKGAGYNQLVEYIKNTTAINIPPTPNHSFHIDNELTAPSENAMTGVLKIRIPRGDSGNDFQEVSLTTNGKHCIIVSENPDGEKTQTSVEEFFKDYTKFKESGSTDIKDHKERITSLEKDIADRAVDSVIHYKHFTQEEVGTLVFKISPDKDTQEVFKNEFESTVTLGTDDGTSINKHFMGLTIDNIEHTYNKNHFYIRDKGNVVDLSVQFYYKDGDVYIRPTQTEGEFILRDKSTNKGTFKKFAGIVTEENWNNTGLTPADEIRPIGQARNEESTSFVCNQVGHGFTDMTLVYFDGDSNTWKKANLENRAVAVLVPIDENYFYVYTNGHIKVPQSMQETLTANTMYYLSQTEEGKMQSEDPVYIYQEIGYCYSKNSVKWFAISIGTPVELAPYAIKDFATKTEMSKRVRYVDSKEMIANIEEPEGCVIVVADNSNWHTRKVSREKGTDPIQLQNGLYANIASSDAEIKKNIDAKFDKGTETNNQLRDFPNAVAVIDELRKKLTVTGDFEGGFDRLLDMINEKVPKTDISQSLVETSASKIPSSAVFKQLVDLVQGIADGGVGAILPQDNTPVHIEEGTLNKSQRTITSSVRALYNPVLSIEGQIIPRDKYEFTTNGGVINLKQAYSDVANVKYVLIDIFPTDIKFVADTVGAVAAAPYASSLKAGDVIRILGRAEKYDGGGHLRVVSQSAGTDAQQIGSLYLNKVKYSDGEELYNAIQDRVTNSSFSEYKGQVSELIDNKLNINDAWKLYANNQTNTSQRRFDFNDYRTPGVYRFADDYGIRDNAVNYPDNIFNPRFAGVLFVFSISNDNSFTQQVFVTYNKNCKFAMRAYIGNGGDPGWTEWESSSGDFLLNTYKYQRRVICNNTELDYCVRVFNAVKIPVGSSRYSFEIDKPNFSIKHKFARASLLSSDGATNIPNVWAWIESSASSSNKIKITVETFAAGLPITVKYNTDALVEVILMA